MALWVIDAVSVLDNYINRLYRFLQKKIHRNLTCDPINNNNKVNYIALNSSGKMF